MTALDEVLLKGSFKIKKWHCSSQTARKEMRAKDPVKPAIIRENWGNHTQAKESVNTTVAPIQLDGERGLELTNRHHKFQSQRS